MSVELLREAAALILKRAKAVPPEGLSDWWFDAEAPDLAHLAESDRVQIATFGHPAVALSVALLLDNEANAWQSSADSAERGDTVFPPYNRARADLLTEVARTYLGRGA